MYRIEDLKPHLGVTDTTVECPVRGCWNVVPRQRGSFVATRDYLCPDHGIFISPSTFEYADVRCNFPLIDDADWDLLHSQISVDKRETHRLARERSEDAVTYNVFRSIERARRLPELCRLFTGTEQTSVELVYWSHSLSDGELLRLLQQARQAFFERSAGGSEPDLIAITPTDIVFIEVKLTSGNETTPSRPETLDLYHSAEDGWYDQVFSLDPYAVAITARKYELMRFWLLGSWMAERAGKRFTLISLTRGKQDTDLEERVVPLLRQNDGRAYAHWSWEAVARFAEDHKSTRPVSAYLRSKSVGYDASGTLQKMLHEIAW
jgi:hypothetical protein